MECKRKREKYNAKIWVYTNRRDDLSSLDTEKTVSRLSGHIMSVF